MWHVRSGKDYSKVDWLSVRLLDYWTRWLSFFLAIVLSEYNKPLLGACCSRERRALLNSCQMWASHLDGILKDLHEDQNVTARLKKVFSLSSKDLPRAQRLAFTKKVLGEVADKHSENAHHAFLEAIRAMRGLTPFLKRKEQSLVYTIAAIEKHSVNHASYFCFEDGIERGELFPSLSNLIEESLVRIFEARFSAPKRAQRKTKSQKADNDLQVAKENQNPQLLAPGRERSSSSEQISDACLFHGASKHDKDALLPRKDSATVAVVVAGALLVRLALGVGTVALSELFALAKHVVVPWVDYLQSCAKGSEAQYQRNCASYLKRIQTVLLKACGQDIEDPATVLRARAYALALTDMKVNQYARDLLRSVHSLTRGARSEGLSNIFDIVGSVYDEALYYVSKVGLSDYRWFSEDVSAWMDNIALVWSKRSVSKPLPPLFDKRISALKQVNDEVGILESCELQRYIIKHGLYEPRGLVQRNESECVFVEAACEIVAVQLQKIRMPSLSDLVGDQIMESRCARDAELHGLRRLRLLRVLEPIRKSVVASVPHVRNVPRGAFLVLEIYLRALLDGLKALDSVEGHLDAADEECNSEIRTRLDKMTGACVEATREVSRHYFNRNDMIALGDVVKSIGLLLGKHANRSISSSRKWKGWIASFFHLRLQRFLTSAQERGVVDDSENLIRAACLAEEGERVWFADDNEPCSFDTTQTGLLEAARGCYVLVKNWSSATQISLKILSILVRLMSLEGLVTENNIVQKAGHCFAGDIALAFDSDESVELWLESGCSVKFLLSVIMEYCGCVKRSFVASKIHRISFDALHSLQRVRGVMLKLLQETSSLVMCPQRKLHFIWVSFTSQASPLCTDIDLDALSRISSGRRTEVCQGHATLNFLTAADSQIECSGRHASIVTNLSNSIIAMSEADVAVIEEELTEAQSLVSSTHDLTLDLELMHLSAEILQWMSSVLATEDHNRVSLMAYEIAQVCRTKLDISSSAVSVVDSCRHLGTLGLRREGSCVSPSVLEHASQVSKIRQTACKGPQKPGFVSLYDCGTGCGHAFKEDTVASLEAAQRHLKLSLLPFMNSTQRKRPSVPENVCQLGGVSLEISFDIRSEFGQARLRNLLVLAESLYQIGSLLLMIENLVDGRYYVEQCLLMSSECMPKGGFFLQLISALSIVTKTTTANIGIQSQSQLLEMASQLDQDCSSTRNCLSKAITMQAVCALALEQFSNRFTSNVPEPIGADLLKVLDSIEDSMDLESWRNECPSSAYRTSLELQLCKGLVHALMRNSTAALELISAPLEGHLETPRSIKLACAYVSARTLIQKGGGLNVIMKGLASEHSNDCQAKRRVTRSRARKGVSEAVSRPNVTSRGVRAVLSKVDPEVTTGYFSPQFCRRIWNLRGVLEDDKDVVLASLVKSIGCTFDLRWRSSVTGKARRKSKAVVKQNAVDVLEDSLREMSISATDERVCLDTDIAQVQKRLHEANCVVVGLSIEETMKYLVVWRISPDATMSKRILLPDDRRNSVFGVKQRISNVLDGIKAMSVTAGQSLTEKEKEEWWEHRYTLDTKVKNIVSDIETEWFGDSRMLLIPSMFERHAIDEEVRAEDNNYCDSFIRLSHAAFAELTSALGHEEGKQRAWKDVCLGSGDVSVGELVLVVDSALEQIPWESLPILRHSKISVTRAPSLRFLEYHLRQSTDQVDPQSLFYVVNPGGDLQRTEETFKDLLGYSSWCGFLGKVPKEDVFREYNNEQVYLYCGHGSGGQYFSPRKFSKQGNAPIALLMGCSSARPDIVNVENCESNGSAIDFLVHGSRAVVGNLWAVGDKDIDRFTTSFLSHWLGVGKEEEDEKSDVMNLAQSVAAARSACHLPYLVGAAAIVMGTPQIWAGTGGQES